MTISLDQVARMSVENYDPSYVIEAVNVLQPLGKDEALRQIESYLNEHSDQDNYGLFWVLRVLFDVNESQSFPVVQIGQPTIPAPDAPSAFVRFPIVIVQDIPLLVVRGYDLQGLPEPVQAHVDFYRSNGTIRGNVLRPPASTDGVLDDLLREWRSSYGEEYLSEVTDVVQAQLARMSL